MIDYMSLATRYAEKYGIITFRVKKNLMIYNVNVRNTEYLGGKWVSKPYTVQRIVNLDTGKVSSVRLQRLQKNGWDNAY